MASKRERYWMPEEKLEERFLLQNIKSKSKDDKDSKNIKSKPQDDKDSKNIKTWKDWDIELLSTWKKIISRKSSLDSAINQWLITENQINIARWIHFSEQDILNNPKVIVDIIKYYVNNTISCLSLRAVVNESIWKSEEKGNIKRTPEEVLEEIQNDRYNSD